MTTRFVIAAGVLLGQTLLCAPPIAAQTTRDPRHRELAPFRQERARTFAPKLHGLPLEAVKRLAWAKAGQGRPTAGGAVALQIGDAWYQGDGRARFSALAQAPEGLAPQDDRRATISLGKALYSLDEAGAPVVQRQGQNEASFLAGSPLAGYRFVAGRGDYVWFVSEQHGLARYQDSTGDWRYFAGTRWMPDDRVTQILLDDQGGAWIGTQGGLACIDRVEMTLEEKAMLFHERVYKRHDRHGMVAPCVVPDPCDLSNTHTRTDDNDGLWTAMYTASECFRYEATKDPKAAEKARHHFQAIKALNEVSGVSGLPARSWDFLDDKTPLHSDKFTKDGVTLAQWRACDPERFPGRQWKGDTSSDEIDGHFFIFGIYYDTVATEEEKKAIAGMAGALMDRIIDGGYNLTDIDGKPTTWGHWSPEELNKPGRWYAARGLNSLEILAYLLCAWHVTGDQKYYDHYRTLADQHHYAANTLRQRFLNAPNVVNHSDDELSFLSFHTLFRYAVDMEHLAIYKKAVTTHWEQLRQERNPLWNTIYGVATGADFDSDGALWTLQRTPLSMQEWRCKNSVRVDLRKSAVDRFRDAQSKQLIAPDERPNLKYNGNPFRFDGGGHGAGEDEGAFFPLAYWMGRAYGLYSETRPVNEETLKNLRPHLGLG